MMERRLNRGLALLLTLFLALPAVAALAEDDHAEMKAYWSLVGNTENRDPLTLAMNGDYDALTLDALRVITADELLTFAAANKLPVGMARWSWYRAMAECLASELDALTNRETADMLALFLRMREYPRSAEENTRRRSIRKAMTEADINAYAAETGLPAGFLAWLLLDDEWYEADWEEGDDWREGRRSWDFADWVDDTDLREKFGKDAVVTEDDVERLLRQNGMRFDD